MCIGTLAGIQGCSAILLHASERHGLKRPGLKVCVGLLVASNSPACSKRQQNSASYCSKSACSALCHLPCI